MNPRYQLWASMSKRGIWEIVSPEGRRVFWRECRAVRRRVGREGIFEFGGLSSLVGGFGLLVG